MLTVLCGEDSVKSRQYLRELLGDYQKKGYEVQKIHPNQIKEVLASSQDISLFSKKSVFYTENLNKYVSRRDKSIVSTLETINKSAETEVIDWEDGKPQRELRLIGLARIREFKPDQNIFQFLENCYPGNLLKFLTLLNAVWNNNDIFILLMLTRQMRNLILAKEESLPSILQSWQKAKMLNQAKHWDKENLISFYDKLLNLEYTTKTGKSPTGIKKTIEILATYYIR